MIFSQSLWFYSPKEVDSFAKCIFCFLLQRLPGILFMCLSVPFLIISGAPTITVVFLRCHIFCFYFQVFIFTYSIIVFDWFIIICCLWYINLKTCFSFIVLNHYIWSLALCISISLDIWGSLRFIVVVANCWYVVGKFWGLVTDSFFFFLPYSHVIFFLCRSYKRN